MYLIERRKYLPQSRSVAKELAIEYSLTPCKRNVHGTFPIYECAENNAG